jgi:hypothetical protein
MSIGDITIDGASKISDNGNFTIESVAGTTIDAGNNIELNADGGNITFKDNNATLLNVSSTHISGSSTSTGSFERLEIGGVGTGSYGHGSFNINYGGAQAFSQSLANGDGYGEIISNFVVHTSANKGDIVYFVDGVWRQADADAVASSAGMLGVALIDGPTTGNVLIRGIVRLGLGHILNSGTDGDAVFVSTNAGHVDFDQPGSGDIVRVAGYAIDSANDIIYFNPGTTFVEVS